MVLDTKEREKKIMLAELKEKISYFLYANYIDFERDKGVIINNEEFYPAFYLNKYGIIIDCVRIAEQGDSDFDKKSAAYGSDGVKHLFMDMRHMINKNVDAYLQAKLPGLGCSLQREI